MKITLDIKNPAELKLALNNAIFSYSKVVYASFLGLNDAIPHEMNVMLEKNGYKTIDEKHNFLKNRLNILKEFYNQLGDF